jgi:hypothetical protein
MEDAKSKGRFVFTTGDDHYLRIAKMNGTLQDFPRNYDGTFTKRH